VGRDAGRSAEPAQLLVGALVGVASDVVGGEEERTAGAVTDVVDEDPDGRGRKRYARRLTTFADDLESTVPVVMAVVAYVSAQSLWMRSPQKVSSETRAAERVSARSRP